jgi:predicted ATPase
MLTLSRLPPRRRVEMIAHVTGGRALPKEIADQIINRTDGVPLFIEELQRQSSRAVSSPRKATAML